MTSELSQRSTATISISQYVEDIGTRRADTFGNFFINTQTPPPRDVRSL